jgi:C-terminal processing protease CtpA/Prc
MPDELLFRRTIHNFITYINAMKSITAAYRFPALLITILFFAGSSPAQTHAAKDLQDDFDLFRNALEEAHGGLYRYSDKAGMDNIFSGFRKKLQAPMTHREAIAFFARLLATTHDGHMRIEIDKPMLDKLAKAALLPFRVMIENDKLMVVTNDTPGNQDIIPGMEITHINGHNAKDLLQNMRTTIPGDGFIETGRTRRLERTFAQLYWLLIDTTSAFRVVAKDNNGKATTVMVDGVVTADREKNASLNPVNAVIRKNMAALQRSTEVISLRWINDHTACLRISSFDGENFYATLDNAFKELEKKQTKVLLLDLSGNGGGVDQYGAYLVAQFMDKPFRYFDRIHLRTINPSFNPFPASSLEDLRNGTVKDPKGGFLATATLHPGVGQQQPGNHPFRGRIIVLQNGGTFSTAADVCALLRHLTKAVFVGEETGGGYEGNTSGSGARLVLPHTKLAFNIRLYDYYNAVGPARLAGRGTMPDHEVPVRVADLLKGVDRQWEKALEIAGNK